MEFEKMKRPATQFAASSLLGVALAFGAAVGPSTAGDATYLSETASSCEIFRSLNRVIPAHCADGAGQPFGKTRSIRLRSNNETSALDAASLAAFDTAGETTEVAAVEQTSIVPGDELSIAMPVRFAYNSDILTDTAKETLDRVAEVLTNELMRDKVILVEGHADAVGSEDYNLELSLRRAQAVQSYLISRHEIAEERLPFLGKGEQELYDPAAPSNGVNRRVEFTNVTG
jgi:outer membrane protein OmpA-like peptidoglycan-associated protein